MCLSSMTFINDLIHTIIRVPSFFANSTRYIHSKCFRKMSENVCKGVVQENAKQKNKVIPGKIFLAILEFEYMLES